MTDLDEKTHANKNGDSSRSKVIKNIRKYALSGIGQELEDQWTSCSENRMSLRDLSDYFNEALIEQALQQKATNPLDGEVSNYYKLLTDDDVSSGARIQAENQLKQQGIDVEELRTDFVSRQAIHTYLNKERGVTHEKPKLSGNDLVESRISTIGRLKNRLIKIAEQAITDLMKAGQLPESQTRITVLVQVQCIECDTQYPLTQFLQKGGCDCHQTKK